MTNAEILEAIMLVCFGLSWPLSLVKNIKARSASNMSLPFILLITFGYIAGISAKLYNGVFSYVLIVYILNIIVVSANIVVYFINVSHDKKKTQNSEKKNLNSKTEIQRKAV